MSTAEAVAALPGGGAFLALWNQVDGNPGAITDLATKLRSTATAAEESCKLISKTTGEVGDAWHGKAAASFTGYMQHFGAAGGDVHTAMDKAAGAISDAANAVEQAKTRMTAIANQIMDRAEELKPLKSVPETYAIWESGITRAVHDGCRSAAPIVQELLDALHETNSTVHSCVQNGGWMAMKAADNGTYLPKPGRPIEWNPIPHDIAPTGTTTPQSSGSSGSTPSAASTGATSTTTTSGNQPPASQPTGNVKQWIEQAKALLVKSGVPASKINESDINLMIQNESSGNPHAINLSDSNAAAGHPSKGLMQTIDSTFDSYALPGHTDIWNPVDNIVAGVRYALGRYGSLDDVPGVAAVHSGGSYVGY